MLKPSEAEILDISLLPWDAQGMGWQATVSQVHIQISDTSGRTGAFCLMPITADYTACSMKGVSQCKK